MESVKMNSAIKSRLFYGFEADFNIQTSSYSLCFSTCLFQSGSNNSIRAIQSNLHNLSTCNLIVAPICQMCRNKLCLLCEFTGWECAVQDVILKYSSNSITLPSCDLVCRHRKEFGEGGIRWCQNCNSL